jgi:hypothetical protein
MGGHSTDTAIARVITRHAPTAPYLLTKTPTHHNITRTTVQRHAQIPNLSILAKEVLQVLLSRLLIEARDEDDPSLDGWGLVMTGTGYGGGGGGGGGPPPRTADGPGSRVLVYIPEREVKVEQKEG